MTIRIAFTQRGQFAVAKALITFPDGSERVAETLCVRDRIPEKELLPGLWRGLSDTIKKEIETWNS